MIKIPKCPPHFCVENDRPPLENFLVRSLNLLFLDELVHPNQSVFSTWNGGMQMMSRIAGWLFESVAISASTKLASSHKSQ
jgi:hypothetical protein